MQLLVAVYRFRRSVRTNTIHAEICDRVFVQGKRNGMTLLLLKGDRARGYPLNESLQD